MGSLFHIVLQKQADFTNHIHFSFRLFGFAPRPAVLSAVVNCALKKPNDSDES